MLYSRSSCPFLSNNNFLTFSWCGYIPYQHNHMYSSFQSTSLCLFVRSPNATYRKWTHYQSLNWCSLESNRFHWGSCLPSLVFFEVFYSLPTFSSFFEVRKRACIVKCVLCRNGKGPEMTHLKMGRVLKWACVLS